MSLTNLILLLKFFNNINNKALEGKTRTATLLLIVLPLASLLSIVYLIASSLMLNNIKLAEEKNVRQSVNEVLHGHSKVAEDLYYTNLPFSKWDESYEFVQNPQPNFIQENFSLEILSSSNLNIVVIFNRNSKTILASQWNKKYQKILPIPPLLAQQIQSKNILVQYPSSGKDLTGIMLLPEGITLISALPILDSVGKEPSRGGLIFGSYVEKSEIVKRITGSNSESISISIYAINEQQIPQDFKEASLALSANTLIVVRNLNEQKIAGYTYLNDIYGKPALIMRVEKKREIYLQGKSNLRYLTMSLIFVGLVFGIAIQIFLQKLITFQLNRQESEARYRIVVGQATESIFLVDAETKVFLEVNGAFEKLLGYSSEEILKLTINNVVASDRSNDDKYLQYLSTKAESFTGEKQYSSRNGDLIDVEVNVNLISYAGKQVFCHVVRDITARKQAEVALQESKQLLAWQANHDALTGLVNRRKFEQHLAEALNSAKANNSQYSLCYLDLDRFKIVNDACGHLVGDELLRQVTALLLSQVRSVDVLARLGGDEFGLLLNECPLEKALGVADALRESVHNFQFVWEDKTFRIGVSIGIVAIAPDSPSLIETLRQADIACYAAKNKGRDRVQIYQLDAI
ncbi:diguanylate cyclase [Synechocystis sp. PCC 7509]|uniref:diguanylate cyclase n=1 Tax=Synechocystis sp. PCC 7509 TaxID=927677 RepID=UPI0002AC6F92|nr:diguanylate cyclase [Synechocystis sp. PCC 7509]